MKKSELEPLIMIFSVVVALFVATFIISSIIPVKNGSGSIKLSKIGIIASEVEINNQITVGDIKIKELSAESINLIETEWNITHTGLYFPFASIKVSHTIVRSRVIIKIESLVDLSDIVSLELSIAFSPSYSKYSFMSHSEEANMDFNAFDIIIKDFYITTTTGKLDITMNNTVIENDFKASTETADIDMLLDFAYFHKNFFCHSNSGIQLFDLWNLGFKSVADFNVTSDTGYIRIHWMNHFNKSQNVNINARSKGDIRIKFWCPLEIMRSDVFLSTVNGSTRTSLPVNTYEEISENHYQTPIINDPSLDYYTITANSLSGEAFFYYVDCFKWLRFCDWGADFHPYNVSLYGNHTLLKNAYAVNTINFYNTKYIYLNESRSLTLNFAPLPVSSEKLLFIEWDLNFIHAMGIGVRWLNLKISHTLYANIIRVYLKLSYKLDGILPTFNYYNITVYYHPNYFFNQFLM